MASPKRVIQSTNPIEASLCEPCGCAEFKEIYSTRKHWVVQQTEFKIVQCTNCKVTRTFPKPSDEILAEVYGNSYPFFIHPKEKYKTPKDKLALWIKVMCIRLGWNKCYPYALIPPPPEKGNVLDIGCSTGGQLFLYSKAKPQWNLYGIDYSKFAIETAKTYLNAKFETGTLNDTVFENCRFDAICFWDVFEHLNNPREVLNIAHRRLNPGGTIHMIIPNFDCFWSRHFESNWWQLLVPQHTYHYTPKTISNLLEKNNFQVEHIRQRGGPVVPQFNIFTKLDEKHLTPNEERNWRLFAKFLSLLDRLRLLPSAAIYVSARKR